MVEAVFIFEVAPEKQKAFLDFVERGTKPWWESHGCLAYTVWKAEGENTFMKRMAWPDLETMEKVMPANEKDPECSALLRKFGTFVTNVSRKTYTQKL